MRSESSSSAEAERAREAARPENVPRGKSRTVVSPEDAKRFRSLLDAGRQQASPQAEVTDITAPASSLDEQMKFMQKDADTPLPADVSSMLQTQRVLLEAPASVVQNAPPQPNAQLADLIEKHVKRMLVSEGASRGGRDAQVVLQLSDGLLSGTQLSLSRSGQGWRLQADASSSRSFDAIRDCAPELARRFAARGLGTIEIDPVLHG
jgi:hypothetical protein